MKHFRKFSMFVCSCLIINCMPLCASAQQIPVNDDKATEKVVDAWISVTTMAFPEAGAALQAGKTRRYTRRV